MVTKARYSKHLFFSEDDKPLIDRFEEIIKEDPNFKECGKGDNKFSASIRLLVKDYLNMTNDSTSWNEFLSEIKSDEKFFEEIDGKKVFMGVGKAMEKFINFYMKKKEVHT